MWRSLPQEFSWGFNFISNIGPTVLFPQPLITYPLGFFIALCQYIVMVCIYCNSKTRITNSRHKKRSNSVWRRRKCQRCRSITTTIEIIDLSSALVVTNDHTGSLQPFSREKLLISIYESCRHRTDAITDAKYLTQTVLDKLRPHIAQATINLNIITATVVQTLDAYDGTAAVYFRAYYAK